MSFKKEQTILSLLIIVSIFITGRGVIYGKSAVINLSIQDSIAKTEADSLLVLSSRQQESNPDKAFKNAVTALKLLQQRKRNDTLLSEAYFQMGRACFFMGLNDSSLVYFNKVLDESEVSYRIKGRVFNSMCIVYRKSGKYQLAIDYADSALLFYQEANDSANIYYTRFNKAKVYWISGEQEKATELLFTTLKYAEESGNNRMQVNILGTIADSYMDLGKIKKAKEFYLKAIDRYNADVGDYVYANILNDYGTLLYEENDYDSALVCYNRALNIYKQTGQKDGVAIASQNIGITYVFLDQPEQGIAYLKRALNTFTHQQLKKDMASAFVDLGTAFMEFKQYDSAVACFHKVLDITLEIRSAYYKKVALKFLYEIKRRTGDYKGAFDYYHQYVTFKDSIDNLGMQRNLQELEVRYKTSEHEKEIIHLKDQELIEKANNRFLTGMIISLILISLLLLFGLWVKRTKDIQLHKQELLISEKEKILIKEKLARQQVLRNQLINELEFKNRQLASHALNMMQKNTLLQDLTIIIEDKMTKATVTEKQNLKEIKYLLQKGLNADKDWELFRLYFEQVNEHFFEKLKSINPSLTGNDYKLCALVHLNMNIKEMASVLNISPNSLKNARYRLKKKLKLDSNVNLNFFLNNL